MQESNHIFQGMSRAAHPIKQDKNFLWDAHNIRLTTRGHETMLSITNEKSTKKIFNFSNDEIYVGHVVLGNYLVILTHSSQDTIYRVDLSLEKRVILYKGNLKLKPENPAQMIADYESNLVQKVYWVDGINSPRVINIVKPELVAEKESDTLNDPEDTDYSSIYKDAPFDFVQELELNEDVKVERLESSVGLFPAGVIQYALTYLHKYGQESNIFYTSEPLYLSFSDRGGSPEDRISASFKITIENIDTKFQYVRVYSILRTSLDATPTVKRVVDYDITKINSNTISIVDNNTTGDIVDPTYLLYVGGKDIKANCIAAKDNTLFLGGITYNRPSVKDLKILNDDYQVDDLIKTETITIQQRDIPLKASDTESLYVNQLSKNTLTFKRGETYRLGCRFQYKNGEWSEPVWVKDLVYDCKDINIGYDGEKLHLGKIFCRMPPTLKMRLLSNGYKRVQGLIALPSYKDRTIIAQGILCPTVGNVGNRLQGGGAYAQSSWIFRPYNSSPLGGGYLGSVPAQEHSMSLPFGTSRAVEIQSMALVNKENDSLYQMSYNDIVNNSGAIDSELLNGAFVVDQSIMTFHSPDIEFGDLTNLLNSEVNLNLHKIGQVQFSSNIGEIDIQTESPVANPEASGFIKRSLKSPYGEVKSLISGLFYEDSLIDEQDDSNTKFELIGDPRLWMTYMWHRTGSLNNDIARPEGGGTRTSVLKKKCICNLKHSSDTAYYSNVADLGLIDIKAFNSNEVSLIKLKSIVDEESKSIAYYGNVDTLIPAYAPFNIICSSAKLPILKTTTAEFTGEASVYNGYLGFSGLKLKDLRGTETVISGPVSSGKLLYTDPKNIVLESFLVDVSNIAYATINISSDGKYKGIVSLSKEVTISDGSVLPIGYTWDIKGETNFKPEVETYKGGAIGWGHHHLRTETVSQRFDSLVLPVDDVDDFESRELKVGDYNAALRESKEGVRMKYKSSPHAVVSIKNRVNPLDVGALCLAELRQDPGELRYGGTSIEALKNNLWIPAGPTKKISEGNIEWIWGDTWFQKYECLKTYPFTFEDINQVTEIGSFYCETRVNIDGRYDRNRGSVSFSLSPTNFNLLNPVYSQLDTFFNTRMLDEDYYKTVEYPSQFLWTETKTPAADTDAWTNLHMANSYDMDGSNGALNAIQPFNDVILGFQDTAVSQILFNSRVQIQASDGIPIEIANSQKVEGVRVYSNNVGCQDKFNITTTTKGLYFIDNNNSSVYRFTGEMNNIGLQLGSLYWFRDNFQDNKWMFRSNKEGNPGIRLYYDPKYQDVYFVPSLVKKNNDDLIEVDRESKYDALCFSEQLEQFTSMLSYNGAIMFPYKSKLYSLANDENGNLTLWENFEGEGYNNIFNRTRPFNFSFISNDSPTLTKIFDTIEMRTDRYDGETLIGNKYTTTIQEGQPFNYIRVTNEYQDTKESLFNSSTLRKKFRIWRALVPRNFNTRERIRNPWAKITLGCNKPEDKLTILHDLSVKYTI